MENKILQIDSNVIKSKKKNSVVKKVQKRSLNTLLKILMILVLIFVGVIFWYENTSSKLIKNFSNEKMIVCKDRLVSKQLGYIYNKNENAFINKKEGLIFSMFFCSSFNELN